MKVFCLDRRDHSTLTTYCPGPTVPESFELSTERRARERQELERLAGEREAELAMLKEEERRREEKREKEEIAQMRQEQVKVVANWEQGDATMGIIRQRIFSTHAKRGV